MPLPCRRLLLTGAAGLLGRVLAPALKPEVPELVLSDLGAALAQHGIAGTACDLADAAGMERLLEGVDAVVHMGGVSTEIDYEPILAANIVGLRNLYAAARRAGTKRIVFASSNHVTGGYERSDRISPADPPRPDGYYGLSKLYGEGMARLYFDRCGIETVCLRIGTATANDRPPDQRALATWLSHADLKRLVMASLTARDVGFLVAYGCSRNTRRWWDSDAAWRKLGYEPQDDAESFAAQVEHLVPPAGSPAATKQGGIIVTLGPFDDKPPRGAT
ncbi:MAG: NAD(P)-dependent oxidoreductase [Rubrivivax sp.]